MKVGLQFVTLYRNVHFTQEYCETLGFDGLIKLSMTNEEWEPDEKA